MIQNDDRALRKIYRTVELRKMSSAEVLEILYGHGFSIMTNSTNYRSTIKLQEFILLRKKESQYAGGR
jgi:hypothetical protein